MNGTVHTIIGVSTGTAVVLAASDKIPCLQMNMLAPSAFIFATTLGSIVPDFDLPGRPLGFLGHRGITHTLLVPALCLVLAKLIPNNAVLCIISAFLYGFAFAWLLHIVADLFQKKGVPLFWPFVSLKKHVHICNMPVKYDKLFLIVYCLVLFIICSQIGFENIQDKFAGSSPAIAISIALAVFMLKKYFGKAWKETVKKRRR